MPSSVSPCLLHNVESPDRDKSYTESIYSRTTSGLSPKEERGLLAITTDGQPQPIADVGAAVITSRTIYRSRHPTALAKSPDASNDWKLWVSSQVSKIETSETGENITDSFISPISSRRIGHIREETQIGDKMIDIERATSTPDRHPLQLLQKGIQSNSSVSPISKQLTPTTSPDFHKQTKVTVSLIGDRQPLRPMQLPSSFGPIANTKTTTPTSILNIDTDNFKNSVNKTPFDTGNLISNSSRSAERSARLRRATTKQSPDNRSASRIQQLHAKGECLSPDILGLSKPNNSMYSKDTDDIFEIDRGRFTELSPGDVSNQQQRGSKNMVDLFLSSRRRRITGGSDESGVFL
ncbi:hypothetical protein F5884DRAFT_237166 [Xylogone sp. PMI_703]|nr:hypothetical protein F5884DRAFT_237166 [Xylogone sp. PMI_703]